MALEHDVSLDILSLIKYENPIKYYANNPLGIQEAFAFYQGLTQDDINTLSKKYIELAGLMLELDTAPDELNKSLLAQLKALETEVQLLWKFEPNPHYHYYEFLTTKCKCSYEINHYFSQRGMGVRNYSPSCLLHKEGACAALSGVTLFDGVTSF